MQSIIIKEETSCLDTEGYKIIVLFFLFRGIKFILFLDLKILNIDISSSENEHRVSSFPTTY